MKQSEHELLDDLEPKEVFKSSLEDGIDVQDGATHWNIMCKNIKTRRKDTWIKRFADNLHENQVPSKEIFSRILAHT